jgi:hypothetical protein
MGWDLVRCGERVWTEEVFRFLEEEKEEEEEEDGFGTKTGEAQ